MLIAEAFVLLALDAKGKVAGGASFQPYAAIGVTGALVTELAQRGHLALPEGRIQPTGTPPEHPLLARTLDALGGSEGKRLKSRLGALRQAGWRDVVDAMVASGSLGREKSGLRPTRHPVTDPAGRERLVAQLHEAATGLGRLDPYTVTLLTLSDPCKLLRVIAPSGAERTKARTRIAAAASQLPAPDAVEHVVKAMRAAVENATIGPVVAGA